MITSIISSKDIGLLSESLYDLRDYCKSNKIEFEIILKDKLGEAKDLDVSKLEIIQEIVPLGDEFAARLGWIRAKNLLSPFLSNDENLSMDEYETPVEAFERISIIIFKNGYDDYDVRTEACLTLIQKIWNQDQLVSTLLLKVASIESLDTRESLLLQHIDLLGILDQDQKTQILDSIETKATRVRFLIATGDSTGAAEEIQADQSEKAELDEKTLQMFANTITKITNTEIMKKVVAYMDKGNFINVFL